MKTELREEMKLRRALRTTVQALDALGEHGNLVRLGVRALADECESCDGSGSAGPSGCTDCLGTGIDPQSATSVLHAATQEQP